MSESLAHIYDLALRALDEQERRVVELRGRLTPVLGAGGIGVTLLAPTALSGGPVLMVVPSVAALAVSAVACAYLLLAGRLSFGIDAGSATRLVPASALGDEATFYEAMAAVLDRRRRDNRLTFELLESAFTVMVCGMLFSVCGLALAAAVA